MEIESKRVEQDSYPMFMEIKSKQDLQLSDNIDFQRKTVETGHGVIIKGSSEEESVTIQMYMHSRVEYLAV